MAEPMGSASSTPSPCSATRRGDQSGRSAMTTTQQGGNDPAAGVSTGGAASAWSPFRHPTFAVLWTATVAANIGTWMYNAASGWLMTTLDPDPFIVSMVQVATTLPMFLFELPA